MPIEVFYTSRNEIMSPDAVAYIHATFANVTFIDIDVFTADIPPSLDLKGHQMKIFAIVLSSFKEVLWLDADNIPLVSPDHVFDLVPYQRTGALFWPDYCNMHSTSIHMWDVMQLPRPPYWPEFNDDVPLNWTRTCNLYTPIEVETGQIVLHKQRTWRALMMTSFLCRHHAFFLTHMAVGDKQMFPFAFNATKTPYKLLRKQPYGVGLVANMHDGHSFFCSNTLAQRHPVTGDIMFLHRSLPKFIHPSVYFSYTPTPRAWLYVGRSAHGTSWRVISREGSPEQLFLPHPYHQHCLFPEGRDMVVKHVEDEVRSCAVELTNSLSCFHLYLCLIYRSDVELNVIRW
jgi:hypothetical protein